MTVITVSPLNRPADGLSRSPLLLMKWHVEALFTHDAGGRLQTVNEAGGGRAPRFFLGRTSEGCLWRFSATLPDDVVRALEQVCRDEPPAMSITDDAPLRRAHYIEILAADQRIANVWAGPCYAQPISRRLEDLSAIHQCCSIDESNLQLLSAHLNEWLDVALGCQPMVVAVSERNAVSVCASVRRSPTAHEAGVETAAEFRGRRFGRSALTSWLANVNGLGIEGIYSTSWTNEASRRLAAAAGLERFGVDFHVT